MAFLDEYVRVSETHPCPRCGRCDWCAYHVSGRKCVCQREPSGKPYGDAGWLHYLPDGVIPPVTAPIQPKVYLSSRQVGEYLAGITNDHNARMLDRQARLLSLSRRSLDWMQARYDHAKAVVVFPMFDALRRPVGCRFRRPDGRKYSLKGGREGLFLPTSLTPRETLFVAEGPTDAAALVEIGFTNVVGRPNCSGGGSILAGLLDPHPRTPVIILADPDDPGIDGAIALASRLPNPTVVLTNNVDIRDYVLHSEVAFECRRGILEGVDNEDGRAWREVYRNSNGLNNKFRVQHRERSINESKEGGVAKLLAT